MTASDQSLEALHRLAGTWHVEATHRALPGVVVQGTTSIEWLEGEQFLILRARVEHPDFPNSISLLGFTERDRIDKAAKPAPAGTGTPRLTLHYFDSRGVFRVYDSGIDPETWRLWRNAPGFSQRFTGTFADGGDTILGVWQLCEDEIHWNDDLKVTYRRQR